MTGTTVTAGIQLAARWVRVATITALFLLLLGLVAVHTFGGRYGQSSLTVDTSASDTVLAVAIAEQESDGRQCSGRPVLTDVVLFQHREGSEVAVLTFDQAIEALGDRRGWIRRYCV